MTAVDLIAAIGELDAAEIPAVLNAITARLLQTTSPTTAIAPEPNGADESLTIEEAAALLRRSTKWIYRHRASLPFIRQIGPRSYVCSKAALFKFRDRK